MHISFDIYKQQLGLIRYYVQILNPLYEGLDGV